jgi:hypothetical protein
MQEGGALAGSLGWILGVGPGAGMALLFVVAGGMASLIALSAYGVPAVRNVEVLLPDHDATISDSLEDKGIEFSSIVWTRKRKLIAFTVALLMAVAVIGLGWLQVIVMTAS